MVFFLVSWLVNALALYILVRLVPAITIDNLVPAGGGIITMQGFITLMIASFVLALLNAILRPLLQLMALPITILTLGLFALVVNGFVFWLATILVPGFRAESFLWAILGGILFGFINWILMQLFGGERRRPSYHPAT